MIGGFGAVVLAAGSSSRMGRPKQAIQFRGQSLLRRSALAALRGGCSPVIVVIGAHAQSKAELDGLNVGVVFNPKWQTGMGSSIRTGLDALLALDPNVAAAVFLLCDQPHVTAAVISRLTEAHRVTQSQIVASTYGGGFGVPALFAKTFFAALLQLEDGAGAKHLIERYAGDAHFLPFPGGELDLDTPDDVSALTGLEAD